MKSLLTVILLVGFVSVAIFGVFGMHVGMQNHDGGCALAASRGTDCPKKVSPIDYLSFHLGAFKNFSTAVLGGIIASLLALSTLAVGITLETLSRNLAPPKFAYSQSWRADSFKPPSQSRFIHWLALHENSPTTS